MCLKGLCCVVLVILSFFKNGSTLQCWKCSSQQDLTCRDYFNITRIHQNRLYHDNINYSNRQQTVQSQPQIVQCDEMYTSAYPSGQRNVCLKRVYTATNGLRHVLRECRLVPYSLKQGQCPDDMYDRNKIEYCGTCDYDGCNSGRTLKTTIALSLLLPLTLLFFTKN